VQIQMLDYEALRAQLIPIHGVFGALAIFAGVIALVVAKRAPAHPWAGRSFMVLMIVAIAIAAPVIIAGRNVFLFGVGLLVVYHVVVAWRLARLKPPLRLPSNLDRWMHPVFGLVFVLFAGYGIWVTSHGAMMGLSAISLAAVHHFYRFMSLEEFEDQAWVGEHIRGVAAAFIASITAFTAAAGPRLAPDVPAPLLWLGPTIVLAPLFMFFGNRVEKQRVKEREEQQEGPATR
jgi:hypothetical protein